MNGLAIKGDNGQHVSNCSIYILLYSTITIYYTNFENDNPPLLYIPVHAWIS